MTTVRGHDIAVDGRMNERERVPVSTGQDTHNGVMMLNGSERVFPECPLFPFSPVPNCFSLASDRAAAAALHYLPPTALSPPPPLLPLDVPLYTFLVSRPTLVQ